MCAASCVPATEFLSAVSESFTLRGTLGSLYSNLLLKAGQDQIPIGLPRTWAVFHRRMPRHRQQCWGTVLVGAAFRKLLRSCLNCHCEKVSKKTRQRCLKTGVKDLVRSTKSTDSASCCGISTVSSVDVDGASLGCCENISCLVPWQAPTPMRSIFVPSFTPVPPLPLFFSLCTAQQSRKPHLKSH